MIMIFINTLYILIGCTIFLWYSAHIIVKCVQLAITYFVFIKILFWNLKAKMLNMYNIQYYVSRVVWLSHWLEWLAFTIIIFNNTFKTKHLNIHGYIVCFILDLRSFLAYLVVSSNGGALLLAPGQICQPSITYRQAFPYVLLFQLAPLKINCEGT